MSGMKSIWKSAKKVAVGTKDDCQYKELRQKIFECRHELAHKDGGLINTDHEGIAKSRSVLAEVVKQVGKQILRGQNLMSVSFPVRCCQPRTILECAAYQFVFCPHYLGLAAAAADPVERIKCVTAAFIACIHTTSQFVKPFNPTLGETLEASFGSAVDLFVEQTSHHPPVTSWLLQGKQGFKYYGWSTYQASFGYNKLFVDQSGLRRCEFADGTVIDVGFSQDKYNKALWGTVVHEILGSYVFHDAKNGLRVRVEMNPDKWLPSDAFVGAIERTDAAGNTIAQVASVQGSFLGFLDFDGERYWNVHDASARTEPTLRAAHLPSDSRTRADRNALARGDEERAQAEKVVIEEAQRRQRRLRAAAAKAKESGRDWVASAVK